MGTNPFTAYLDLADEVAIPEDGIISRTLLQDDRLKAVLFGFSAGQELSEHTAAVPAIMHVILGEARVTVGTETFEASEGSWIHMQPNLSHSVYARVPVVMLLLLLKSSSEASPNLVPGLHK